MDVRLDFECKENMPANTTIYCFIIYNRVIQYNPLTNVVRKITFFRHSINYTHSTAIECSLLNMLVPMFMNLQGFIVNKKFIAKKVVVLKHETILTFLRIPCHRNF